MKLEELNIFERYDNGFKEVIYKDWVHDGSLYYMISDVLIEFNEDKTEARLYVEKDDFSNEYFVEIKLSEILNTKGKIKSLEYELARVEKDIREFTVIKFPNLFHKEKHLEYANKFLKKHKDMVELVEKFIGGIK